MAEQIAEPEENEENVIKKHDKPVYLLPEYASSDHCCVCDCVCPYSKYKEGLKEQWDSFPECYKRCCCGCKACLTSPCCYLCCCYDTAACECICPRCLLCPCCYFACCQTCPRCLACGWCLKETRYDCRGGLLSFVIGIPFNLCVLCFECCECQCCYKVQSEDELEDHKAPNQLQDSNAPNEVQSPSAPNQVLEPNNANNNLEDESLSSQDKA